MTTPQNISQYIFFIPKRCLEIYNIISISFKLIRYTGKYSPRFLFAHSSSLSENEFKTGGFQLSQIMYRLTQLHPGEFKTVRSRHKCRRAKITQSENSPVYRTATHSKASSPFTFKGFPLL